MRTAPFQVTRTGHSPFTAGVVLHFPLSTGMKPMVLSHTLNFGVDEKKWDQVVYLPKRKISAVPAMRAGPIRHGKKGGGTVPIR